MKSGLTLAEVKKNLEIFGYNELPNVKSKSIWGIAFEVIKEPMFLLLIASGTLYILLGDATEGIILLSSIFIIIFITFYQYQKTEKALEALKQLSSPRALVIRDGIETRIPGREVVPNDIIVLNEGDRIPADSIILETPNLVVDESMLTGESVPVSKHTKNLTINNENHIYSGTLVLQGKGYAIVTATGIHSQFGKIGKSLQSIVKDQTRLQKELKGLIRNLFVFGAIICVGIVLAFYFYRGNFLQSLLNGLAAAMAVLPEEFPVVLTIFLAMGAWRLSKKNVLTRMPSVIETLGSTTVLCCDKTGTITQNKMEIVELFDGKEVIAKADFSKNKSKLSKLIISAKLASHTDSFDPMEKAIFNIFELLLLENTNKFDLVKEYPLTKDFFAMTRIMKKISNKSYTASIKGAPEAVLNLCKLNKSEIETHLIEVNRMAANGFRVIAVGTTSLKHDHIPTHQNEFIFEFLGLIALEDPIRPEVPAAVKECYEAGIKVVMITGDYPITAKSIANQIGLATNHIITGDDLKKMTDEELKKIIKDVSIFARVVPEQKLRIVQLLKAKNEIVAMTGDGVNDAPALKAANIGIAMGNRGTDVAREAAALVLLDDNFASIVAAIRSGRKIFDNLQKAMSYILAIHIPIIGLTLLPAFFPTLPLLLFPLHIVFMELLIDPSCSIAFEYEQEEKNIMKRPPRNPNKKFFGGNKLLFSIFQGFLLLLMVVAVYYISLKENHTEGEIRAIAFSSLIIGNIFLILTNLSKTRSFLSVFTERNFAVLIILFTAFAMLILIISVPYLQQIFYFEFPGFSHFLTSITSAIIVIAILEIIKYFRIKRIIKLKRL